MSTHKVCTKCGASTSVPDRYITIVNDVEVDVGPGPDYCHRCNPKPDRSQPGAVEVLGSRIYREQVADMTDEQILAELHAQSDVAVRYYQRGVRVWIGDQDWRPPVGR